MVELELGPAPAHRHLPDRTATEAAAFRKRWMIERPEQITARRY